MSESQQSIGANLRAAREAQGYTVQEAANHLRLMNRQVEAMENDDFSSLGQPVFARGFVRNYARLLGLDSVEILSAMGGDNVEPIEVVETQPVLEPGSWMTSRWVIAGLIGLLILIAVPIALYVWLNSDEEASHAMSVVQHGRAPAVTALAPAPPVKPLDLSAPTTDSSTLDTAGVDTPAVDAAGIAAGDTSLAPESEAPLSAPPPASGELHFEFADDAWVEIRDGTGRMVHRQMNRKGSSVDVSGQPPFNLVVGNAAQVQMTYNGRPLDLKPYIEVTVARFNLEE